MEEQNIPCQSCGQLIAASAKFCSHCGEPNTANNLTDLHSNLSETDTASIVHNDTCPNCKNNVNDEQFCVSCGYPLKGEGEGEEEDKKRFMLNAIKIKHDTEKHEKRIKGARVCLYILTGLAAAISLFLPSSTALQMRLDLYSSDEVTIAVVVLLLVAVVYLATALWSRKNAFAGLLVGLIFYATMQIIPAILEPAQIFSGIIFKILFFALLINGLTSANALRNLHKQAV